MTTTRIAEYKMSEQSVREWCAAREGVSLIKLWYWPRKYKDRDGVTPGKSNRGLPVEISNQLYRRGPYFTGQNRTGQHRGMTRRIIKLVFAPTSGDTWRLFCTCGWIIKAIDTSYAH